MDEWKKVLSGFVSLRLTTPRQRRKRLKEKKLKSLRVRGLRENPKSQ